MVLMVVENAPSREFGNEQTPSMEFPAHRTFGMTYRISSNVEESFFTRIRGLGTKRRHPSACQGICVLAPLGFHIPNRFRHYFQYQISGLDLVFLRVGKMVSLPFPMLPLDGRLVCRVLRRRQLEQLPIACRHVFPQDGRTVTVLSLSTRTFPGSSH